MCQTSKKQLITYHWEYSVIQICEADVVAHKCNVKLQTGIWYLIYLFINTIKRQYSTDVLDFKS